MLDCQLFVCRPWVILDGQLHSPSIGLCRKDIILMISQQCLTWSFGNRWPFSHHLGILALCSLFAYLETQVSCWFPTFLFHQGRGNLVFSLVQTPINLIFPPAITIHFHLWSQNLPNLFLFAFSCSLSSLLFSCLSLFPQS